MKQNINLQVVDTADDEQRELVYQLVRDFNDSVSPCHREIRRNGAIPLDIYATDQQGNLIAALVGETYWQWLAIDYLWITEEHRRFGLGSLLVLEAETAALSRDCTRAKVSTFSFQAPLFYEKLGYQQVGKLEDYPPGADMLWFKKQLA